MTEESLEEIFYQKARELKAKGALFDATIANLESMKKHDKDTYYHQIRVALIAARLAEILGYKDIKPEFFGGANHDVGKLKLDSSRLRSKSLSSAEFEEIKKHVEEGSESLKRYLFVSTIAAAHHTLQTNSYGRSIEDSLANTKITAEGKKRLESALIHVSIADFFDACHTRASGIIWNNGSRNCSVINEIYPNHKEKIVALNKDWLVQKVYNLQ